MALRYGSSSVYMYDGRLLVEQLVSQIRGIWTPSGWYLLLEGDVGDAELGGAVHESVTAEEPHGFDHDDADPDTAMYPKWIGAESESAVLSAGRMVGIDRRKTLTVISAYQSSGPRGSWQHRKQDHRSTLETPGTQALGSAVRSALLASVVSPRIHPATPDLRAGSRGNRRRTR